MENISLKQIIKNLKNRPELSGAGIPLEYNAGYPIMFIRNSKLCVLVPFLKYKITGIVDQTLVYPVKYTVTLVLPECKVCAFENLVVNSQFEKVDFSKPIGFFRHESVKQFTKSEYEMKRDELFGMYDKMIQALIYGGEYSDEDDEAFRNLLNILIEPSLKPIYKTLDRDFYDKYLQ